MILFRIFFNLFGMATRLLFLPFHLIMHNLYLVLIVIALILVFHSCSSSGPSGNHPAIPSTPDPRVANPIGKPGQIDPIKRRENGDSAFSTDLYASMSDAERGYYSAMFYSVMENVPDNQPYEWQNINISGKITPTRTFTTGEGYTCRDFTETLKVHAIEENISGIACPRTADVGGWCKLKPNATPACGLHTRNGDIFGAIKGLF